jgi:sodium/hydrogen antiporter
MFQILALTGVVILTSAVASGVFERRGVSLVLVFLAIGLAAGPYGLGIAAFDVTSRMLQLVATVSLTMVLFADAVSVQPTEMRTHARLAGLILGPGTIAVATLIALAAWKLLGIGGAGAAMIGAALASTDPVLLRSVLRNPNSPPAVRQALRMESGLNDAVLVPVILIAMTIAAGKSTGVFDYARTFGNLLVVGPVLGAIIGLACVTALDFVRSRFGMRRDYESLYTLGVALTAFAAAEAVHSSGYLAAFSAGLAIAFRDVELCDCFHDYGEATAEVALLITFVALGGSAIWSGLPLLDARHVLFVVIALSARPLVLLVVLRATPLSRRDLALLAWFGPRGLSTMLLILLPVFAGVPGAPQLFAVCSLVVLASIFLHGASPALLMRTRPVVTDDADPGLRISIAEMLEMQKRGETIYVLDVRQERSFLSETTMARGALRVNPDHAVTEVRRLGLPRDAWLVLYCT